MTTTNVEPTLELRRIRRYYVQAPVFFSWKNSEGISKAAEGMTRDISTQAVFVSARDCPTTGDRLRVNVVLPSLSGKPGVRLHGEGIVLRVDGANSSDSGFAMFTSLRSGARDAIDDLLGTVPESGRTQ